MLKPLRANRRPSQGGGRGRTLSRRPPSPRVAFPGAIRRVSRALAPGLVWIGSGIAVVLLLLSLAANRLLGIPFDPASLPSVVATLALAAILPWTLQWKRFDEMRRYFATCIAATLLVFVTRPEGIVGGSIALAGGVIGILRRL